MSANNAVWLLPGDGEQSAGPFTTEQVVEQWRAAKITLATVCWREGMPEWKPVGQVPILREAIERAEAAQRGRTLRMVAIGGAVALAVIAAAAALVLLREPREITEAKAALASGQYAEAEQTLLGYVRDRPRNGQALCLLGAALANDYASTPPKESFLGAADQEKLQSAGKAFARAFEISPTWRRMADTELAQALERVPADAPDALARVLAVQNLRQQLGLAQPAALAQQLLAKLSAPAQRGPFGRYLDEAAAQVVNWDRSRTGDVARIYLQLGKAALPNRPAEVAAALDKALKYDPSLDKTDDGCLAILELTEPSAAKLARCQSFLAARPDSPVRAQVLLVLVDDALKSSQRGSWAWGRDQTKSYLDAGLEAAKELKAKYPSTQGVEGKITALVAALVTLAEKGQQPGGTGGGGELIRILPDTPEAAKVKTDLIRAAYGNLPEDLAKVAETVEQDLKFMGLTDAGAVGLLAQNPKSVHVVDVTCHRRDFRSDQAEALRRWVRDGGVLWCRNDVLDLFQIAYNAWYWWGSVECEVAVTPEMCPVVTGCRTVRVSESSYEAGRAIDLRAPSARSLIPLLKREGHAYWTLVPYGKGWVSNVPKVDVSQFDGARMWLNFRLFCLGRSIPGAPVARPATEGAPGQTVGPTTQGGAEPPGPARPPPPAGPLKHTLTVRAKLPEGATVSIQAAPSDLEGKNSGTPIFTLSYTNGASVELTAPDTAAGRKFLEWSGADSAAGTKATLIVRASRQVTALYDLAEARQSVANWAGQWQTVEFGVVELKQEGDKVTGSYHEGAGRINGAAVGDILQMEWSEGQLLGQLHRWRLERDGSSFTGAWRNKGAPPSAETTYKGVRKSAAQKP